MKLAAGTLRLFISPVQGNVEEREILRACYAFKFGEEGKTFFRLHISFQRYSFAFVERSLFGFADMDVETKIGLSLSVDVNLNSSCDLLCRGCWPLK